MARYRKKPVVIEASQWFRNGDHPLDYSKEHEGFENGEPRWFTPEQRRAKGWEGDRAGAVLDPIQQPSPADGC